MQQNCAEVMLEKAAELVLNKKITFQYNKKVSDEQIDLSPAFTSASPDQIKMWYSGYDKKLFEKDLGTLDKEKVYFFRTGQNGQAGHWSNLFFDKSCNLWTVYSSEKNNFQLKLDEIDLGQHFFTKTNNWGNANGQYSLFVVEANVQNIIRAANYLYDHRMLGEDVAIYKQVENPQKFYEDLLKHTKDCVKEAATQYSISKWNILLAVLTIGLATLIQLIASSLGKNLWIMAESASYSSP